MINSSPHKTQGQSNISTVNWVRVFGPAEADAGGVIDNPYDLAEFRQNPDDPALDVVGNPRISLETTTDGESEGRVLCVNRSGGELEILPLFSDPAASGTVQVFGFEAINTNAVPPEDRRQLIYPHLRSPWAFGIHYLLSRDDEDLGSPAFVDIAPNVEFQKVKFTDSGRPYFHEDGDVYHIGTRHKFCTTGLFAFFFWVPTLTSGELVLLARAY